MVQIRNAQEISITAWWDQVHPYAVALEKNITTSPTELNDEDIECTSEILPQLLSAVEQLAYPQSASHMHDYLIRAITYLIHAYQELKNNNHDEVDFYYFNALTQVAQLHHQLVQHGFAN